MEAALRDAGVAPGDVGYVNTRHLDAQRRRRRGKGAAPGVRFPSAALLLDQVDDRHALGAAGALEVVFCTIMLEQGLMAPSINVDDPDLEVAGLPLVIAPREAAFDTVLSNSFGFGGTNAALVLRRA